MNYLSIYYYTNHDAIGSQLHTRLHLGLNHLGDHKLRQNFQDCIPYVYLRSRYWKNKPLCPPPPQSSLCKVNLLSQGKLSKWKHLKTEWFCKYKDSAIRWQWTRFWNKQNFTNVCNRVHFINRDIQLSHNQSNIYFLWLVILFLHAKLGPLILASGCSGSLVNLF